MLSRINFQSKQSDKYSLNANLIMHLRDIIIILHLITLHDTIYVILIFSSIQQLLSNKFALTQLKKYIYLFKISLSSKKKTKFPFSLYFRKVSSMRNEILLIYSYSLLSLKNQSLNFPIF